MIFIIIEFESFFLLLPLRFEVFLGFGVFDFDDEGKRVWKTPLERLRIMTKSTHFQLETTSLLIGLVFFCAVFGNIDLLVITVSVATFKHWVKVKQN